MGAAMTGLRPVVEIMFMDFVTLTMDAVVNQAAKARFMFGGQARVPVVVRLPQGIMASLAAQHSQSLEAWYVHTPGLVVLAPSTPADCKGLLKSAIRCDDPVILIEPRSIWQTRGEVPDGLDDLVPIAATSMRERTGRTVDELVGERLRQCTVAHRKEYGGDEQRHQQLQQRESP